MPLYVLLDEKPRETESLNSWLMPLEENADASWIKGMGFNWAGRLKEEAVIFADGSKVAPFPDKEFRKDWLTSLLTHLHSLRDLRENPNFKQKLAEFNAELDRLQHKKNDLLAPAREFAKNNLGKENYRDLARAEFRKIEKQKRLELLDLYTQIKESEPYKEVENSLTKLIDDNRDLFESSVYSLTKEEAQRRALGSGIIVPHDSSIPPTISEKIESITVALEDLDSSEQEKNILSEVMHELCNCHNRVALLSSVRLSPAPLGVVPADTFLSSLHFPLPSKRILILR